MSGTATEMVKSRYKSIGLRQWNGYKTERRDPFRVCAWGLLGALPLAQPCHDMYSIVVYSIVSRVDFLWVPSSTGVAYLES